MNDYILFMHNDAPAPAVANSAETQWGPYLAKLRASGRFDGGSSIGAGECANKFGTTTEITTRVVGYLRVRADSLAAAREFLAGNPVFEAGGTVEIRELPKT